MIDEMIQSMTVEVEDETGNTRTLTDVIEVRHEEGVSIIQTLDQTVELTEKESVNRIYTRILNPENGDFVTYFDPNTDSVCKGQVTGIRDDELTVKQLPDGFQVAVDRSCVIKIHSSEEQ